MPLPFYEIDSLNFLFWIKLVLEFINRICAAIIDHIIVIIFGLVLVALIFFIIPYSVIIHFLVMILFYIFYFSISSFYFKTTIGKIIFGFRLNYNVKFTSLLARELIKCLSIISMFGLIILFVQYIIMQQTYYDNISKIYFNFSKYNFATKTQLIYFYKIKNYKMLLIRFIMPILTIIGYIIIISLLAFYIYMEIELRVMQMKLN